MIGIGTRPVIDGNGQVVHEIALAGIVKVNETRDIVAVYQHIVFEQVGMNDAMGQIAVVVGIQSGNRVFEQSGVHITHQGQQALDFGRPPRFATRILHRHIKALPCHVHFGQHFAD